MMILLTKRVLVLLIKCKNLTIGIIPALALAAMALAMPASLVAVAIPLADAGVD